MNSREQTDISVFVISFAWFLPGDHASIFSLILPYGQRHAKRDLSTYAKSVDPDQPLRLRRSV